MLTALHIRRLYNHHTSGPLKNPVNMLLDDYTNLSYIQRSHRRQKNSRTIFGHLTQLDGNRTWLVPIPWRQYIHTRSPYWSHSSHFYKDTPTVTFSHSLGMNPPNKPSAINDNSFNPKKRSNLAWIQFNYQWFCIVTKF